MRVRVGVVVAVIVGACAPAASADVVLNEVNCEGTDLVELVNTSGDQAEVSGWLLTDAELDLPAGDEHLAEIPNPTAIAGNGDLVLERDTDFDFGISCSDTLKLGDASGDLVDQTTIGDRNNTAVDSWGRYPNGTGPFTANIPTRGEPNEPSTEPGEPPEIAAWLYDPANVVEIDLELSQQSIEALELNPLEYVDGSFSLSTTGGSYGPLEVGVRLKGHASFRTLEDKAAFKVKFNHSVPAQRFLGLKGLTLNNMVQDQSMLRELITYELSRGAGVAAPRTGYAYVRLNGEDYGLYLNVETPDEIMLARWFDSTRHLFEGGFQADVTAGGRANFEVDEGSESDLSDLDALIAAADPASGDWSDQISPLLDLEQATRMWAVETFSGHWDGYAPDREFVTKPNNFYLHSDDAGRFSMLPWGADLSLGRRVPFDKPAGLLFRRCLQDASCFGLYRDAVIETRSVAAELDLVGLATSTAEVLEPWQELDPRKEFTVEQLASGLNDVRAYLLERPADVDAWLAPPHPPPPDPPTHGAVAPQTKITSRPRGRTTARRVRFKFSSTAAGSGFECKLNRGEFRPCAPPRAYRVGLGRHRFLVRAIGPSGVLDPSAAEFRFEVVDGPARRP